MLPTIKLWVKEFRLLFLFFVVVPLSLGAVIAYEFNPAGFSLWYLLLSVIAILLLHAGTIAYNDYFDYVSGCDVVNKNRTPFTGGSGLLPEKMLKPIHVLVAGTVCFVVCASIGLYLVLTRCPALFPLGVLGCIMGACYTAPPLRLAYRLLGEVTWFLSIPLIAAGTFLVQVPVLDVSSLEPLAIILVSSMPLAFMGTAGLCYLEFPDFEADRATGKRNLTSILGRERSLYVFYSMAALSYLSLVTGIAAGLIPVTALIVFLTVPFILMTGLNLRKNYRNAQAIGSFVPVASIGCFGVGVLMTLAFII